MAIQVHVQIEVTGRLSGQDDLNRLVELLTVLDSFSPESEDTTPPSPAVPKLQALFGMQLAPINPDDLPAK